MGIHARQRITVTGNHTASSHHPQFFMQAYLLSTHLYNNIIIWTAVPSMLHLTPAHRQIYTYTGRLYSHALLENQHEKDNRFSYINCKGHSTLQTDKGR